MLGDVIDIYYDPFSRRCFEGKAKVISITKECTFFYYCIVEFVEDKRLVYRKISKE
jgi:hypothetical protein